MLLTEKELLEQWPLNVGIPQLQGHYFLFNIHTYNLQGHALLGKTLDCVIETFIKKLDYNFQTKPVSLYEVDIVSPPQKMRLVYAKEQYVHAQRMFKTYVEFYVRENPTSKMPAGVKLCTNNIFHGQDSDISYSCPDCDGSLIKSFDSKVLENKYLKKYIKEHIKHVPHKPCLAPPADPRKKLYVAQTSAGHHQSGLELMKPGVNLYKITFACHARKLKIPDIVYEEQKKREQAHVEEEIRDDEARKARRAKEDEEQLAEFEKFWFGDD